MDPIDTMRILVLWPGLPDYAARLLRAVIEAGHTLDVVGTRPSVPVEGMERSLGQRVHWVSADAALSFDTLGLPMPDLVLQGGYATPAWRTLNAAARAAGRKVVLISDNNLEPGLKHALLDPIRHRLMLRRHFDAVLVPGKDGTRYAKRMGYGAVVEGAYGADPALFFDGPPASTRERTILFVGQFIERKKPVALSRAFAAMAASRPDWRLHLCGGGVQAEAIARHPQIIVEGFRQPPDLSALMRTVRVLALPSIEEHWGLVVHEGTLSGCALLTTPQVGAAADLATPDNAVVCAPTEAGIASALADLTAWTDERFDAAQRASRRLSAGFGPARFAAAVDELIASTGATAH